MAAPDTAIELKAGIAAVIAFAVALWGKVAGLFSIWAIAMALDYITGTAQAWKSGTWNSGIAREGVWHKLGSVFAVLVAGLCDIAISIISANAAALGMDIDIKWRCILTPVVLSWYTFTELGSITENAAAMGAPVPEFLKKAIKAVRDATDKNGNTDNESGNTDETDNE